MSGQLVSLVGKRILAESARNHFGQEDPYFEEVPASRLNRAFGKKTQKRRKAIPPGLSENDRKVLTQVKRRAYRLDLCLFSLCGIQFGWSSVIALVPFVGDAADAALAMMVVNTCDKIDGGLPARLRTMMLINVLIDFAIGLVPFVGDIADAIYKCNTRNAVILEKHLREKGAKALSKQRRRQDTDTDPSLPDEFDRYDQTLVDGPSRRESHRHYNNTDQTKNESAVHPRDTRKYTRWFGGSSHQRHDLEAGVANKSQNRR
ncbi:PH domain protein [Aspergillus coremiiformis]|uniref:PH domain protein n=1 Tax=Aspergillus coremiiformis TaxID=138285 RepID=A0A5N6Z1I4_9EURO|nr:PH domain protein [Aspergillus coremiiformis]